ncbi:MAG: hypothetical protein IKZ45_09125 [Fibrobacter sp.]|nr:hypothetical protein [Fibrobacter sp.]
MLKKKVFVYAAATLAVLAALGSLEACAGDRQGLVCSEIQYRLDTQTYSPDQRAYIEEELRVCREEEAKKRGEDAAVRQGIYERYAATQDTSKADSMKSVSEALGDSSGEATVSIYDRYKSVESSSSAVADSAAGAVAPAASENDTASVEAGSFQ